MSENGARRRPRVLSPEAKWEIFLEVTSREITQAEAARRHSVDFPRARRAAFAIVDVVSRRWIDTLVSVEETSTQVRVLFDQALAAEGLTELITPEESRTLRTGPD